MLAHPVKQGSTLSFQPTTLTAECIGSCLNCKKILLETVVYCSERGGELAQVNHLQLLLDCAMLCEPSAYFISRESLLRWQLCEMCAQLCHACAEECQKFGQDSQLETCAEMCLECAGFCERIAASALPLVA